MGRQESWRHDKDRLEQGAGLRPVDLLDSLSVNLASRASEGDRGRERNKVFHTLYTRYAIVQKKPKYLLMENVKALVTKKFLPFFNMWKNELESYGYDNFAQVLNASDYGVPQNRERIFLVSIRNDGKESKYRFPKKMPLEKHLVDVLESDVDEKYYLSDKMLEYFNRVNEDETHCHKFKPRGAEDNAFTIRTRPGERVDDNFIDEEKIENSASNQEGVH